mgnify:FL=1
MLKSLFAASLCTLAVSTRSRVNNADSKPSATRNAISILYPDGGSGVTGVVSFSQDTPTSKTNIIAHVRGLKPNSLHGFHIHEYGDLTEGCKSAGPHFNPHGKEHGGPLDKERHVGDLGNLKTDDKGVAYAAMTDELISLFGENSVIGRSVVVHADQDDLGRGNYPDSKTTGHSGARIACGVIALCEAFKNIPPQ